MLSPQEVNDLAPIIERKFKLKTASLVGGLGDLCEKTCKEHGEMPGIFLREAIYAAVLYLWQSVRLEDALTAHVHQQVVGMYTITGLAQPSEKFLQKYVTAVLGLPIIRKRSERSGMFLELDMSIFRK